MEYELIESQLGIPAGTVFEPAYGGRRYYCTDEQGQELFSLQKQFVENSKFFRKVVKRWRAKKGDGYYYIDSEGIICTCLERFYPNDDIRFGTGNYFKTREQAQRVLDFMKEVQAEKHEQR